MVVENNYISILTKNLPKHWESFRVGSVFVERTEKVSDKNFAPLSVTMKGIVPQLDSIAKTNNGDNRKKVCINDFVINSRSDRKGSGGMSKYEGSVSLINTVLKPNDKYENRYTNYLFTNVLFQEEFYKFGKGIVDDMWSTKYFDMKYIKVPCPPIKEQIAIANHLDNQSKKIKDFIKKKQTFIELLKEQRQAVINKAVTKGINPNVTLKDSGIDWLGDIPEHWEVRRLKYLGEIKSGEQISNQDLKDVGTYEVYGGNGFMGYKEDFNVEGLNIIIGRVGAKCGNIRLINEPKFISDNALVLNLNSKEYYLFTSFVLKAMDLNRLNTSNAQPLITGTKVMNVYIPIPPKEEQTQIVSHIKTETTKIDQAITKAQKEIALIKEYKEAMIAEAVLGKLKVSEL